MLSDPFFHMLNFGRSTLVTSETSSHYKYRKVIIQKFLFANVMQASQKPDDNVNTTSEFSVTCLYLLAQQYRQQSIFRRLTSNQVISDCKVNRIWLQAQCKSGNYRKLPLENLGRMKYIRSSKLLQYILECDLPPTFFCEPIFELNQFGAKIIDSVIKVFTTC